MTFKDFDFNQLLQEGLDTMGYKEPTPIQTQAIPLILEGKDLIACAQTGTGKTASYLLPVLNKINNGKTVGINTLILAPTRELAQQIDQQIEGLAYFTGNSSIAVYGGGDGFNYEQQRRSLNDGVDIIVATPGRLIAHLTSGTIKLTNLKHLILDEADRMMDMGFYDDIVKIISYLPEKRQNLMFSATMPHKIRELTKKILHNPAEVNIEVSKPSIGILQQAYLTLDEQKASLLKIILKKKEFTSVIIFASRKEIVKKLASSLERAGVQVDAFHSDLDQAQREKILMAFRGKQIQVIIGTDVLSRGIDVAGISLVINYDVPPDPEDYIHRIGRTARADTTGTAISFINQKDQRKFGRIEKMIEREIPKIPLPESLGQSFEYNPFGHGGGHSHHNAARKWKKKPSNVNK